MAFFVNEELILGGVNIIVSENDIIDEAAKLYPKKPKGIEINVRCSQEHKAEHKAAFKVKSNSTNKSAEIEIKKGHGKNAVYGYFPAKNSDKNLTQKEQTYIKKFAEKNAETIDKIWGQKKESKEYNEYMKKLKKDNPDCTITGDLGGIKDDK